MLLKGNLKRRLMQWLVIRLTHNRLSGLKVEIDELVVSIDKRGLGLGGELIRFMLNRANELGAKEVIISSNRERESYKRDFYKKHGFIEKNSAFFQKIIE